MRSDPPDAAAYASALAKVTVGRPAPLTGPVVLAPYNPCWPVLYERERARIRRALGARAILIEHAGSTSVPGLWAKPILDIVLEVPDASAEAAYLPDLEAAGYVLRIREPEWFEHRLCKGSDTDVNLHIFPAGCEETARMLRFRDWLRAHPDDRELYLHTKRALAAMPWTYMQQYADAKTEVVRAILARAAKAAQDSV